MNKFLRLNNLLLSTLLVTSPAWSSNNNFGMSDAEYEAQIVAMQRYEEERASHEAIAAIQAAESDSDDETATMALIAAMQAADLGEATLNMAFIFEAIKHQAVLQPIATLVKNFPDNTDVHGFNSSFVTPNRDIILGICENLALKKDYSFDQILSEISNLIDAPTFPNFTSGMAQLKAYMTGAASDPETGINTLQAISMCWDLCKKIHGGEHEHNVQVNDAQIVNIVGYFAWSIGESQNTGGGCYAGYAGRLFRDLVKYLAMAAQCH